MSATSSPKPWGPTQVEESREHNRCLDWLRSHLQGGQTICALTRNSPSAINRRVSLFAVVDGKMEKLDYYAAKVMLKKIDGERPGLPFNGGGFDAEHEAVEELSKRIFGDPGHFKKETI